MVGPAAAPTVLVGAAVELVVGGLDPATVDVVPPGTDPGTGAKDTGTEDPGTDEAATVGPGGVELVVGANVVVVRNPPAGTVPFTAFTSATSTVSPGNRLAVASAQVGVSFVASVMNRAQIWAGKVPPPTLATP